MGRAIARSMIALFALAACFSVLAACGSHGSAAAQGYQVCNTTNATIHIAVAYHRVSDGGWTSSGWTDAVPGTCASVLRQASIADNAYYVYAYISNEKTTNNPDWGGYDYFCLNWAPSFSNDGAKDNANCTRTETQNEEWVGFAQVDTTQDGGKYVIHY
jgi:uncharacterized membrane protein